MVDFLQDGSCHTMNGPPECLDSANAIIHMPEMASFSLGIMVMWYPDWYLLTPTIIRNQPYALSEALKTKVPVCLGPGSGVGMEEMSDCLLMEVGRRQLGPRAALLLPTGSFGLAAPLGCIINVKVSPESGAFAWTFLALPAFTQ